MKKKYFLLTVLFLLFLFAQGQHSTPLFQSKETLNVRVTGSIKSIKKKSNDSTFVAGKFEYEQGSNNWISVPVQARVRGNFRLAHCHFPPLKLKFSKKDIDTSLFKGNKALKLVVPCKNTSDLNTLIRKEYLCYQFYEVLSPYHFKTRLANLTLTELSHKKPRTYELLTFFVEDNSRVAKRHHGRILETRSLSPGSFDAEQAIRNDFIQYMIGNADWSAIYQHNANVLFADGKYITLSYDFDMSGFVNASYAQTNPLQSGTGDPRERVYRGFCKSKDTMEAIRKEFLEKELSIQALIDHEATYFRETDVKDMHVYVNQFYDILKSDDLFKSRVLEGCRTK